MTQKKCKLFGGIGRRRRWSRRRRNMGRRRGRKGRMRKKMGRRRRRRGRKMGRRRRRRRRCNTDARLGVGMRTWSVRGPTNHLSSIIDCLTTNPKLLPQTSLKCIARAIPYATRAHHHLFQLTDIFPDYFSNGSLTKFRIESANFSVNFYRSGLEFSLCTQVFWKLYGIWQKKPKMCWCSTLQKRIHFDTELQVFAVFVNLKIILSQLYPEILTICSEKVFTHKSKWDV